MTVRTPDPDPDDDFGFDDVPPANSNPGWLTDIELEEARRRLPMLYVEAIPVRTDGSGQVTSIGVLLRSTPMGEMTRTIVSGRVRYGESIRDALFPGGAGPVMTFTLEPKDLSPSAARVTLNLDGQVLNYFNSATRPAPMTWPGKDGTGVITLAFQPVDGSPEVMVSETGSWAWLRLLREGRMQATELPELFRLRLAARGHYADFELRANSVDNPFDLQMFSRFSCPERI